MVISSDKKLLHLEEIPVKKEGLRLQGILSVVSTRVEVVIQSRQAQIRRTALMDLCN